MARELYALIGERAPPIPIGPQPKKYKAAPGKTPLNARWSMTPFTNQSRADHLLLKHWRRKIPNNRGAAPEEDPEREKTEETPTDQEDAKTAELESTVEESEYAFEKYNMTVKAPDYTLDEYEQELMDADWSKEETDYLMTLYTDFFGKWPVVWDRFEYIPPGTDTPTVRSLEHLKARFYAVSAKIMRLRTPQERMSAAEFADHSKMEKFNPDLETRRKRGREALMLRSADEVKEERYLLDELRRIYSHQEKFAEQLKELRERLDHGLTDDKSGNENFTTHAQITSLFQRVLANDKTRKMQRRPTLEGQASVQSPVTAGPGGTPTSAGPGQAKRGSISGQQGPTHRQLTSRSEARWGVSTHERLTPGITFRSDRLNKLRQAKSQIQTNKIRDVLNEIDVPEFLQMPTEPVCAAMERLVGKVVTLLEARKMREKEENEIMIEKQRKELAHGGAAKPEASSDRTSAPQNLTAGDRSEPQSEPSEVLEQEDDAEGDAEGDEEGDDDLVEGDLTIKSEQREGSPAMSTKSSRPGTRNGKRSASELSDASRASASKRSRKV